MIHCGRNPLDESNVRYPVRHHELRLEYLGRKSNRLLRLADGGGQRWVTTMFAHVGQIRGADRVANSHINSLPRHV
jgi:hypothetical protein